MTGPPPQTPEEPGFQASLETMEGAVAFRDIPPPVNPLQAQTAYERRARMEDMVAHIIAIIQTSGFFVLAFAALLGYVDLSNSAAATFLGTVMGYAVGKIDPVLTRYFAVRIHGVPQPISTTPPPTERQAQTPARTTETPPQA